MERAGYKPFPVGSPGLGVRLWRSVCVFVLAVVTVIHGGCGSIASAPVETRSEPTVYRLHETCRLAPVRGDASGVVTADGSVVIAADGPGILRSDDDGETFVQVARPRPFRWPSVAADGSRVWVSWVRTKEVSTAVVAALGTGLGLKTPVMESSRVLIDTELLALGGGHLLLFVTEIDGSANQNNAVYTIHCLGSKNGGLTWGKRSIVTTGPRGINLEDTRAVALSGGHVLLAFEWEGEDKGASQIMMVRSTDQGTTWSQPTLLWGGGPADREPGGFGRRGKELWFVASTDEGAQLRSYSGARIALIRSRDEGLSWSSPKVLIDEPNQLAMGIVVVGQAVLVLSVRNYEQRRERALAVFRIDPIGRWRLGCGGDSGL